MFVGVVVGVEAGNVTGESITAITYNSVSLGTALVAKTMANGSNSAFFSAYGMISPTTGSNTLAITTNLGASANNRITVVVAGHSGVASFGNVASRSDTATANSNTLNLNCAVGNVGIGFGCHGSAITTVDQTLRGAVNNFSDSTALSNAVLIENAGAGASTPFSANSAASDQWGLAAVELVATAAAFVRPTIVVQPSQAVHRAANWRQKTGLWLPPTPSLVPV